MSICLQNRIGKLILWLFAVNILFSSYQNAYANECSPNSSDESSLAIFLKSMVSDRDTQYIAAFRDLNDDGISEAIVYLMGGYCGSGGCNTLILNRDGASWRAITMMTVSWPPIYVLNSIQNGWRDIGVFVEGGGIYPGYEVVLSFDGNSYPRNPTVAPSRRMNENDTGEIVIASRSGAVYLYRD